MGQSSTSSDKNANYQDNQAYTRKSLRRIFRDKRSAITPHQQASAAKAVLAQAINHKIFSNCARIGIYLTHEGELNTRPIIEYLWSQGIEVYLPVLHPFSKGYLVFLHYTTNTKMKSNVYGISEPLLDVTTLCPLNHLDIILAPLVAFDNKGNRMGMGGGFYDRTLMQITRKSNADEKTIESSQSIKFKNDICSINDRHTRLIGLAHDEQKTISLPTQVWDIPLPEILTPTTLYSF